MEVAMADRSRPDFPKASPSNLWPDKDVKPVRPLTIVVMYLVATLIRAVQRPKRIRIHVLQGLT